MKENWKQFIQLEDIKPGKMYGIIKIHKEVIVNVSSQKF